MTATVHIAKAHITLGQLVKLVGAVDTGGQAKWFLAQHEVWVNGVREERRGRKLYPGDVIVIDGLGRFTIAQER